MVKGSEVERKKCTYDKDIKENMVCRWSEGVLEK